MTIKNFKFKNKSVPDFYRYPLHNMIIGDYFAIKDSVITPSLHEYFIEKALKSGKVLITTYEIIDDVKHSLYMCIDDFDNLLSIKDRVTDLINENGGKASSAEIHDLLGGNRYKKFKNLCDVNEFDEFALNSDGRGRPKKYYQLPDTTLKAPSSHDVNIWDKDNYNIDKPIIKPQDSIKYNNDDLAIDNEEKEFIFNPELTDTEFSKLSFDERTQWQLMNTQYKEGK